MIARSFLVEVYAPCNRESLADTVARARAAARAMTLEGTRVRYRGSITIPEDETCFHLFEGPSAEAVSEASRRAALEHARVVEAVESRHEEGKMKVLAVVVTVAAVAAATLSIGAGASAEPRLARDTNGKIAFTRRGAIYVINPDGSGLRRLTRESLVNRAFDPEWSPDGRQIAYSRRCAIYVMNGDGSRNRRLTRPGTLCAYEPTWSPDGRRMAFVRRRTLGRIPRGAIHVMNADGTELRAVSQRSALSRRSFNDLFPAWSPDGGTIAFARLRLGSNPDPALYLMSADGSRQRRLTSDRTAILENMPVWSPDGATIAFGRLLQHETDANMVVAVVGANGVGLRNLMEPRGETNRYPAWSPDGRKIVFINGGLVVTDTDGSDRKRLTASSEDDAPDWQPVP